MEQVFIRQIAGELSLKDSQVRAAVELLDNDNTIPFIARYRKEMTGSLNEVELRQIEKRIQYLRNLESRKKEVLESIEKQGKLTDELRERILNASQLIEVEDLYLPYRPKKRTKGQKAKEMGLEPLCELIYSQQTVKGNPDDIFSQYINEEKNLPDIHSVREWSKYLIAEWIAENADIREKVRKNVFQTGILHSEKLNDDEGRTEFEMYYEYEEAVSHIPPHRILAINRGENKSILKVKVIVNTDQILDIINQEVINNFNCIFIPFLHECSEDGYKRLLYPSLEREARNYLSEKAELHAIKIFGVNLKNLLLSPPVREKVIMGIDPGFRTGCKVAVIDIYGNYLAGTTIYPTPPRNDIEESEKRVLDFINQYQVDLIAIGNGTASRETEHFIAEVIKKSSKKVVYLIVSEAGASVYSASETALEEFPELDASMRGNISIARRVIDPLSELVKIDPKSIGVGLYQHDVNQKELASELSEVVKHCVNYVGVDLNHASVSLLQYVSGVSKSVARNIVDYRTKKGPFQNRKELMKVKGLGEHTFQQCAGFLRIAQGDNPLDNTNIHPESYEACEKLFKNYGLPLKPLKDSYGVLKLKLKTQGKGINAIAEEVGIGYPTLEDIFENLEKPGRDPRDDAAKPIFREDVLKIEDLKEGMILKGTVRNVVDFGVFVDIGIKREALLHRSQLNTDKRQFHPSDIVAVGDVIEAKVISVDLEQNRVSLSMKEL